MAFKSFKNEIHLNVFQNCIYYLKENTTRLRYKDQLINAV
jgi:hypothetical protein